MKTAKLFSSLLHWAKSRRDDTLLTVCFSLRTFGLRAILLPALLFFTCTNLHAQVTIGGTDRPKNGAILDLNSTAKGGLLLSNVTLLNLYTIPVGFPGIADPGDVTDDVKKKFTGAMVYHKGGYDIPAGIYVWNGTNWTPAEENCTPLDAASLKVTASSAFAKVGADVTFSVSSGATPRCAEGEKYNWRVNDASFASFDYPVSIWTTSFPSTGNYKVKVVASSRYGNPSPGVSGNEVTFYVTDGSVPPELINADYGISGGYCYDVKGEKKGSETDEDYIVRVDAFANDSFTKTFRFTYTKGFSNLSVLTPDDPAGIVDSVSQPADNSGSGNSSVPFTVTFKNDVQDLVVKNNAPAVVKLLVSYTDINGDDKIAYLDIKVQDADCYCPVRVPESVNPSGCLTFMCRNLGADYEIRSVADLGNITNTNFYEYHGDYYRFGVSAASVVNSSTTTGAVSGWGSKPVDLSGDWLDTPSSPLGNPCPDGWRLPTENEWRVIIANNTLTYRKGTVVNSSWSADSKNPPTTDNYRNILQIGDYLFLLASGGRVSTDGTLASRGEYGAYWGSTNPILLSIRSNTTTVKTNNRLCGYSVRCVQTE
jgi:uncharacterized protein (TIGR02145 family)